MTDKTYGKMDAAVGEKCGNLDDRFTCPGCYTDHFSIVTECSNCAAPLKCYEEEVTNYFCAIRDPHEDNEDD